MAGRKRMLGQERHDALQRMVAALRRMEAEVKGRKLRVTRDIIARDTGIARSAVSAWFAGRQLPRPKQLDALAEIFSFGDDMTRMRYRRELFEAAGAPIDQSSAGDPLMRARERSSEIVIRVVQYDEVGVDDFFHSITAAFGDFCAFPANVNRVPFQQLSKDIASGAVDVGAGLWETPDRLLTMRFIGTPIAIGMNMVTFASAQREIPIRDNKWDVDAIAVIMTEGQATYTFALHVLEVRRENIIVCPSFHKEIFASTLRERFSEWERDKTKPIPVILSDEVMCLKVINELLSDMDGLKPWVSLEAAGPPVMLMGRGKLWAREGQLLASHPQYNAALCVRRVPNDEWYSYIEDAWRIFLASNFEFLSAQCVDLMTRFAALTSSLSAIAARITASGAAWHPGDGEGDLTKMVVDPCRKMIDRWLTADNVRDRHGRDVWREIIKGARGELRPTGPPNSEQS